MLVKTLISAWGRLLRYGVAIVLAVSMAQGLSLAEEEELPENWEKNKLNGDVAAIAAGKAHWKNIGCYACHGRKAEGGVGPSLSDDIWIYKPTDKMVYNAIARGRSGTNMVGWSKDLTPRQIWELVAFIRSLYIGDPEKIIW
tara:strand:- start:659 stop:1084 length:426 start_codon:yes stop_codon:yes gene_type:complete